MTSSNGDIRVPHPVHPFQNLDIHSVSSDSDEEHQGYSLLNPNAKVIRKYKSNLGKCIAAFIYGCAGMFTQALAVVYVNDNIPNQQTFPRLPDIFLDNMPLVPWGFKGTETIIVCLLFILSGITICHKYR